MILLDERSNISNIADPTVYAYEALLEFSENIHKANEEMMITEHTSIVSENMYMYNEGVRDFFDKIKETIVNLIKKFINWIDKAISTIYYHVKASGNLRKHANDVAKGAGMLNNASIDLSNTKMRYLITADEMITNINRFITEMKADLDSYETAIKKVDTSLGELDSDDFSPPEDDPKKLCLQNPDKNEKQTVTKQYLLSDKDAVIKYCNGNLKLNIQLVMNLKDVRAKLKKAISTVQKNEKIEQRNSNNFEAGTPDSEKAKLLQKRYSNYGKLLSYSLKICNGLLGFVREKNIQLNSIANIYYKIFKRNNTNKNESAMYFDW